MRSGVLEAMGRGSPVKSRSGLVGINPSNTGVVVLLLT